MKTKPASLLIRYMEFLIGLVIVAGGICLITKAGLGTSPVSCVPFVISLKYTQISFGTWTFLMNVLFFAGEWLLLQKQFDRTQRIGQIPASFVFGWMVDVWMNLLAGLQPQSLWMKLIVFVFGCAVLGFGVVVEVAPDVLMVPADGFAQAIAIRLNKPLGTGKNIFDAALTSIGLLLCFLFFGRLNGIGVGTILAAVLVGRFVALFKAMLASKTRSSDPGEEAMEPSGI